MLLRQRLGRRRGVGDGGDLVAGLGQQHLQVALADQTGADERDARGGHGWLLRL